MKNSVLFEALFTHATDAAILVDLHDRVMRVNPAFEGLFGYADEECRGRNVKDLLVDGALHKQADALCARVRKGETGRMETVRRARDGTAHHVEVWGVPIFDGDRQVGHFGIYRDISAAKMAYDQLEWQADHDPLTGLLNRSRFERDAQQRLESACASGRPQTLIHLDINQFKVINDTCGYQVGDELICELLDNLRDVVRRDDLFARIGGDEFVLLLDDCAPQDALKVADKLIAAAEQFVFVRNDRRYQVGISLGLVDSSREPTIVDAMKHADYACQSARQCGSNRISVYAADNQEHRLVGEMMQATVEIDQALHEDRFRLYFQEISALRPGLAGRHFELLLRMLSQEGELVSPGVFIPAAERYNRISVLDRWVLSETLSAIAAHRSTMDPADVYSINLSGITLSQEDFLGFVRGRLDHTGVDPRNICFEITESCAIGRMSSALAFIEAMRELGCSIWLDDFGSGLSSFGYLQNLPVDGLKIDGSLVRGMRNTRAGRAIVKAIVDVAHAAGIVCVAEQVETGQDLEILRELGVDFAQGFLLHRPEPWRRRAARRADKRIANSS